MPELMPFLIVELTDERMAASMAELTAESMAELMEESEAELMSELTAELTMVDGQADGGNHGRVDG